MGKGRFIVNPFDELVMTPDDRFQLQELAHSLILTNLDHYNTFVCSGKGEVDSHRWKQIKAREQLLVFEERSGYRPSPANRGELTGSGLPMILCVGSMEGKLEDLMYGAMSEDLETMRLKASYVDDVSGAAVLASIVEPTTSYPFQSLMVKWMEIDIPIAKNRDYVYLEGTGMVKAANGDRLGYQLLHSVEFPQTDTLPYRVRGNISIMAFWRQARANTIEMYATGIFDPCGDMIRKLSVPRMADVFLSSVKYPYCGQMRKLSFMLDKAYAESRLHGTPNKKFVCVNCSSHIMGRRFGDFSKSSSTCKLCFGHVCHGCKVVQKMSFVCPDLMLTRRKVTFCRECICSVTSMSAAACARTRMRMVKNGITLSVYSTIDDESSSD
ncbi:hypothetical protein PHYBOEH_006634 [Phytophthora boehmeriae]|uniref:FYVE-type domain-containing protein n=1 Tax=Phytophthora boehmeriae TaxID=109152 RepID=A0A8T1WEQ0_9STRA|nr:hypothetical protein PHYBOEH_006634 [Phytophthora boehmeriae]